MDASLQLAISMGVPTLAVLVGILINNSRLGDLGSRIGDVNNRIGDLNSRINDLSSHMDRRFDDMKETWRAELYRVEGVLDARLKHIEDS
jgi:hypothetical protein